MQRAFTAATSTLMLRLAYVYNPKKSDAQDAAQVWAGQTASLLSGSAPVPVLSGYDEPAIQRLLPSLDLLVCLGGDGTLLRAARLGAASGVAALGVKFGHVGFLSELSPADFPARLPDLLAGHFWTEERVMLQARLLRGPLALFEGQALNDVVVSRGQTPRLIYVGAHVDGALVDEIACDGVICATATGSTAYSLACGGPILAPTEKSLLLTAISPYLSPIRTLVLPPDAAISLHVRTTQTAGLTLDGQEDYELRDGDVVEVSASPHLARLARLVSHTYFYETIKERLRRTDA